MKSMSSRPKRRKPFVPKSGYAKKTSFDFEIKIVGGLSNETSNDSSVLRSSRIPRLQDFESKLRDVGFILGRSSSDGESRTVQDQDKEYIKYKLTFQAGSKVSAFEKIRQEWCTTVCNPGYPFWLESSERIQDTFRHKAETSRHDLQPKSCSFGSFFDRGTFVEHYTTKDDVHLIEDEAVYSEFVHDTKVLTLAFRRKNDVAFPGLLLAGGYEIRIEFEYKQFEDYILVDEKQNQIDLYLPLTRPPKVTKEEEVLPADKTNETRCVGFLNCNQEILGKSSVLRLRFESSKKNDRTMELIKRLGTLSRTVYFVSMRTRKPCGPTEVPVKPHFDSFEVAYALECLLSQGFKVTDRVSRRFYDLLPSAVPPKGGGVSRRSRAFEPSQICHALYQLIAFVDRNRFCPLENVLEQLLFGKFKKKTALDFELPKHYVYVPRIIVTPTQNLLVQPELVAENRVVRQYGHEYAMRIAFREEDFSKLSSFGENLKDVLETRVVKLLGEGIHLCGRHFEFLACSNSQLRDHGAWLYAFDGNVRAEDIRQSLGELEKIYCVATYVSRMGQCFSSTKESVKVSIADGVEIREIPDIEKPYRDEFFECCQQHRTGTYIFSDGIGKISQALAENVAESLGLRNVPSAYQIRYAGCKGMLAVDLNLQQERKILQYRKSMSKFDCDHKDLEICEFSRPNVLYLNRQCICLLSGLGVPDEAFVKLQDTMLMRLASMLLFENVALEMLSHASVAGGLKISSLRKSGLIVTCEPFFRSLLLAMYKSKLGDLLRRARIAVPQSHGRLLVGVLDETQTLEYGQVFIRYTKNISEPDKEYVTLIGDVVVTKNPCFHPGDMRKLQAVDNKALHHLVDCIVFPVKGPRPHTNEISGSDLDGDKYFVTWYRPLIPPNANEKPMDFPSAKKIMLDRRVNVGDMIRFVADYIKNDQLGPIANSHLVHADSEEKGVKSEKCIRLAHMHSDAVDFPKTGECPSLTHDLRPEQYPDFMMKTDKPRYKSKGILGKLFQKCNQLERARYFISEESPKELELDPDLILEGYQDYVDSAIEMRDRYNTKLGSLMALYGLKNEGEVLTGCLTKVHSRVSGKTDEKFEVAQLIQASIASLRNHLKNDFYDEFGGEEEVKEIFEKEKDYPDEVLYKASAWYVVTYRKMKSPKEEDAIPEQEGVGREREKDGNAGDEWAISDGPLISFPWIVCPILAHIKASANKNTVGGKTQEMQDISRLITIQADSLFFDASVRKDMMDDFEMRQHERDELLHQISTRSSHRVSSMPLLGASMTGLNIRDKSPQPLQMYVESINPVEVQRILNGMRNYAHTSVSLDESRTTVHFKVGDLKCSITTNKDELLKSVYIYRHIQRCPRLLHLLLVIVHWGRKRHMTGSSRDSFMTVEDLAVLFIRFCEERSFIDKISESDLKEYATRYCYGGHSEKEMEWRTDILEVEAQTNKGFIKGKQPGMTLIEFFEFYGGDCEDEPLHVLRIRSPVQPRSRLFPYLTTEDVQRFTDAALHSIHEIAQCRGLDRIVKTAEHESSKEMQETLSMPYCTWGALRFAEDFVAHGLSALTDAKVNIRPAARRSGYIMEVRGNYLTLYKCQVERQRLESKSDASHVYDHTINGGNYFFFIGQTSDTDRVTAKVLKKGDFAVNLVSASSSGNEVEKLGRAVWQQLQEFSKHYVCYLHGSKNLRISVEYGSIYVADAYEWVRGSNVGIVESALRASAYPKHRGTNRRSDNPTTTPCHRFRGISSNSLADIEVRLSELGEALLLEDKKFYMVEIKIAKNHDLKIVYDENLKFERYDFEPFKWLVADLKTPRPNTSRTRDIDLRVLVTSQRELNTQEAQELPIYETFGKNDILTQNGGQLTVLPEYRRSVAYVHEVTRKVYMIDRNGSTIFVEVSNIKKKNQNNRNNKNNKPGSSNEYWTLRLYGDFNSDDIDMAQQLTRDILSLGKDIKPRST